MSAGYRMEEARRMAHENNRHNWEVSIAHAFRAAGHTWADSLRLARRHFELDAPREGDNGGPILESNT